MNAEEVKTRIETDLLAIIKEGQNLEEGYVEVKPGVRIRAGREREFERLCDNYYELEFNQVIENDTDTITPVYQKLTELVESENEDYYISKASSFVSEVKSEVERFKALTKSYNTVDNAYKLTVRNLNDLYLKRENTPEWQQKVNELNGEVGRLTENSAILTEQILAARKNVNEALIKYAEEQMTMIRDSFLHTTKEADKATAIDHNVILANDKLEYDSLYRLTLILKHANEIKEFDKLVCLDDNMIVTEEQKDILTSTILPNVKLYDYIKAPEKKESTPKDINNEFIEVIKKYMKVLEEKGESKGAKKTQNGIPLLKDSRIEYDKLLDILKIINKANASDFALSKVWGKVYVLEEDRNKLIELLNDSKMLNRLNPDFAKREENEKLIQELYAYLDEMANKVTSYKGVANLPIKSTKTVGDRAWVVTANDFEEANRIVEIINLLLNQTDNLVPIWGIANVNIDDMPKFKRLANATKRFGDNVPSVLENEEEMKKVHEELKNLIRKTKETENAVLAANGLVLEADYPLYKLLEEKYRYLEDAKVSDNLVTIDGVLVDGKYVQKYHEINEKINSIINGITPEKSEEKEDSNVKAEESDKEKEVTAPALNEETSYEENELSANDKEIARLKARLEELKNKSSHNEIERAIFDVLTEQIEMLERGKNSIDVVEVNGVLISAHEKEKYLRSLIKMDELMEDAQKEQVDDNKKMEIKKPKKATGNKLAGLKKKIVGIRKLGDNKFGKFIKENWRLIIAGGLATAAILYFLPQLVPALIYANSCNAAAIPALSGALNAISSAIAPLAGITFVPGMGAINLGVSANLAGSALINALAKAGIVTVAGFDIGKSIKQYYNRDKENQLSDPKYKTIAQKVVDTMDKINDKYGVDNLESNPDLTPTNLIQSQIEYESNLESLEDDTKDEQPIEEVVIETPVEPKEEVVNDVLTTDNEEKQVIEEVIEAPTIDSKEQVTEEVVPEVPVDPKEEERKRLEERKKRGEEIIKLQKQRKEELKRAKATRAKKDTEIIVHDVADDEALKRIQERAAEFIDKAEVTEVESQVEEKQEMVKPVVEIPSTDEVISKLAESEDEPELLDVEEVPTKKNMTARVMGLLDKADTSKTEQVMDTIINGPQQETPVEQKDLATSVSHTIDIDSLDLTFMEKKQLKALIEKAANLQFSLEKSVNPPQAMVDEYERQIKLANIEIDELMNKGRGR